jgi:hypothetical protein
MSPKISRLWLENSFIASSLVVVGFYIRLKITETPAFEKAKEQKELKFH